MLAAQPSAPASPGGRAPRPARRGRESRAAAPGMSQVPGRPRRRSVGTWIRARDR
jgi:hypothetical protein